MFKKVLRKSSNKGSNVEGQVGSLQCGGIAVILLTADIAELPIKVDVIVTTVTSHLNHDRAKCSKDIVEKAGKAMQLEIRKHEDKVPLKEGDLIATSGGSLACSKVYHLILLPRKQDYSKAIKTLVKKCLEEANVSSLKTIAFPALGTGKLRFPKSDVANAMFEAVEEFSRGNPSSSVCVVYFVLFPSNTDVFTVFKTACAARELSPGADGASLHNGRLNQNKLQKTAGKTEGHVAVATSITSSFSDCTSTQVGSLENEEFFFGNISRVDAEQKLLVHPVGVYLVRNSESKPGSYVISVGKLERVKHYIIQKNDAGMFYTSKGRLLQSVQQVIYDLKDSGELVSPCPRDDLGPFNERDSQTNKKTETSEQHMVPSELYTRHRQPLLSQAFASSAVAEAKSERMTIEFCSYMYTANIHPPPYWTKFTSDKSIKEWKLNGTGETPLYLVDVDQETYTIIQGLVRNSWEAITLGLGREAEELCNLKYDGLKITKIQRVENPTLYEQYATRRQAMFLASGKAGIYPMLSDVPDMKGGASHIRELLNDKWSKRLYQEVNEEYFFHGTKTERAGQVYAQGLDPRLAAKGVLGPAVYMAENSTKADQYSDSKNARRSTGLTMFLVRACLGNICRVTDCRRIRRPPCTDFSCNNHECQHVIRYDSVVSEEQFIFREFVVYDGSQVYPEYVINYDRV
ncbi:protein mono-ADP-ribosyltransferase PARP15-like isoform X2 [Dreissena polymorpha]|uniref:protein mono-ADP-ribosyltransferase PARP15-like isoform X2 n=1 Tax=Dreissena polymorpha TaxID=45954 RepID=UPI0022646DD3|nr:protein mono-ADP-ribosyltransferase PARP15-like isoform X2 [Dreissena polymorpha]